jgi:hypothetical protein
MSFLTIGGLPSSVMINCSEASLAMLARASLGRGLGDRHLNSTMPT